MTDKVDDFLAHYGVAGMKWGRRKARPTTGSNKSRSLTPDQKAKLKKAAVILGTAAVVGALTVVAVHSGTKINTIPKPSLKTEEFVAKKASEPISVIHATRAKNKGFSFYEKGGLSDPLHEYDKVFGGNDTVHGTLFKRYGDNNEKVAIKFYDPEGRKDHAGRVIPHEVILPAALAKDVHNLDDAVSKVWPMIKDAVDAKYDEPRYGP